MWGETNHQKKGNIKMAEPKGRNAKSKTPGKTQMTILMDDAHAALINEMQAFYNLSSRDDLFMIMIEKYHEYYLSEKDSDASIDEIINDMQNRLGKLEDKFSRILEPVKLQSKRKPVVKQRWAHP